MIYVNRFSKTLSPRLRVGYLAASPELVACLLDLKLLTHVVTSELAERIIHHVMTQGQYRKYLSQLRTRLSATRARVIKELEELGFVAFADIGYGYFVWMRHPHVSNTTELTKSAFTRDMLLAPGGMFSPGGKSSPWLRFNVAHTGKPAINALRALLARH